MKNKLLFGILLGVLILIVLTLVFINKEERVIGGDKDSRNCLIGAGYSWNESEKECVREWENGEERYQVRSFQNCIDAGYPVLETYPQQCKTLSGRSFTEDIRSCQDNCGNGICEEIVCMAIGCPCSETKESCPQDC